LAPEDPPEGFVQNYTLLVKDRSFSNFQKVRTTRLVFLFVQFELQEADCSLVFLRSSTSRELLERNRIISSTSSSL